MAKACFILLASAMIAGLGPAAGAQVRVVVDGQTQDVPDGVIRTITVAAGHRTVHDEPFKGAAMPGAATITTTETTDEDGRGRAIRTTVVTRIVPLAAVAYTPSSEAGLPSPKPAIQPVSFGSSKPAEAEAQVLRIRRDPVNGHFITTLKVNGVAIRAIIDTGASGTILSPRDAMATGASAAVVSAQRMIGIGGYTMLKLARIRSLEVGGEELGGFTAAIGQEGLGYTLLGQSEIARLGRIVIEGGTMTIMPRVEGLASR